MKSIPPATLHTALQPREKMSLGLSDLPRQPDADVRPARRRQKGAGERLPAPAVAALRLFATYDLLRVRIYRERGPCGARFDTAQFGSAPALRSEDVGYFNRVYAPDQSVAGRLAKVEAFYADSPFGCELIGPPSNKTDRIGQECGRRGWSPGLRYAWLAGRPAACFPWAELANLEVRSPDAGERELFLRTYLTAFEAKPHCFAAAIQNMSHLFEQPNIFPLLAIRDGEPAAVGVLFRVGTAAILCAGATVPRHRQQGCHRALLAARLRLAAELGCKRIYSWAAVDGQSHANMEHAGLRTVGMTQAWRLPSSLRGTLT